MSIVTLLLLGLLGLSSAQYRHNGDPRTAAILSESRFLSGDGSHGAAYVQEDGVEFKEEADAYGNRRGQYSYVDPSGQKITLQYTAGVDGFQVSGDHLPKSPAPPPSAHRPAPAPAPYRPQPQPQPQSFHGGSRPYDDGSYNPDIYERQYSQPQHYSPRPQQPQQYNPPPQQQYNPPPQQYNPIPSTPPPNRFFPPGKLSLSRSADGYQYSFSS